MLDKKTVSTQYGRKQIKRICIRNISFIKNSYKDTSTTKVTKQRDHIPIYWLESIIHVVNCLKYCVVYFRIIFFVVNNYEISTWEGVYLNIWIKNNINPYITVDDVLGSLSIDDMPIFRQYFSIYSIAIIIIIIVDDQIDICTFLEFVVVFGFFHTANLIPCIINI